MENIILLIIVLLFVSYYGFKIWKLYQPKKTITCIDNSEFQKALDENQKIQLIDVRSKNEYNDAHIPNAINIPLDDLKKGLKRFDKETKIVIVCLKGADRSKAGAIIAAKKGFDSRWLCGGISEWVELKN